MNSIAPASISTKVCPKCAKELDGLALLCPGCWTAFIGTSSANGEPNWAWMCQRLMDRLNYAEMRLRLQTDGSEKAWELVRLHRAECDGLRAERYEWMQVLQAIPGAHGDTTVARAWVLKAAKLLQESGRETTGGKIA